jgi:hypothetical protein
MGELVSHIASFRQPAARRISIPAPAIRVAGWIESAREVVTRRARPFNRDKANEILQDSWLCDPAPLLSDLGIHGLEDWREGIRQTAAWYGREGWLASPFSQL